MATRARQAIEQPPLRARMALGPINARIHREQKKGNGVAGLGFLGNDIHPFTVRCSPTL